MKQNDELDELVCWMCRKLNPFLIMLTIWAIGTIIYIIVIVMGRTL